MIRMIRKDGEDENEQKRIVYVRGRCNLGATGRTWNFPSDEEGRGTKIPMIRKIRIRTI